MRRVPRWWAGKGLAAKPQTSRPAADLSALHRPLGKTMPKQSRFRTVAASRREKSLGSKSPVSRKRDAITTRIAFRTPPCSSVTASMQPKGPARERRHRACQRGSKRSRGGRALVNCVSSICCKAMP
ncbi:hypothetical protein C1H21_19190 [Xanthomonas arboricola pv. juglandis]|nr:hypothetical protein C1H21_19190 [Xanthomonas arboricola pv. juglandis]